MQTQCPHCKSRYRLSPEMIDAYGGFVRCGNCDYKFNVHDQVRLDNDYFELSDENAVEDDYTEDHPGFRHESDAGQVKNRIEPLLDAPEEDELNIRFSADEYEFEEDMPDTPVEKIEPRFEFPSRDGLQDDNNATDLLAVQAVDSAQIREDQIEEDQVEENQVEVGQIEEGQIEEGQIEEGQIEEGQIEEGQIEEGQIEEGQVEEGQVEEGQVEEGQVEEGQVEEGQIEEGQVEEGQVEEGQVEEGQVEEGQVEEGQVEEGQIEEGQIEEGQIEEGQIKDDEVEAVGSLSNPFEESLSEPESKDDHVDKDGLSVLSAAQSAKDQIEMQSADFDDFHFGEKFEVEGDDPRIEPSFASQSLINDDAEETDSGSSVFQLVAAALGRFMAFSFWLIAAIALAYLLLGQIKDRVYPAYKHTPVIQSVRDGICGFIPCVDVRYDIEQYEIVVSRMDEINAGGRQLHISVFLLNKAQHAQAYPNLLITLKRMDGTTTGRRVISPEEYTTSHNSLISSGGANGSGVTKSLIKPNKLGKILIKFDKPPADAVGFEARVVR